MKYTIYYLTVFFLFLTHFNDVFSDDTILKNLRYLPDEDGFLIIDGEKRFNRALYGGNTAFRVEAGDLPEFALYLPGMGGNIKIGLLNNENSIWLTDADYIKTKYIPGSMEYIIKDSLLGSLNGYLKINVLALYDREGLIIKISPVNLENSIKLIMLYGGLSEKKFSRNGDIGADPESCFYLLPEYCKNNSFIIEDNIIKAFNHNNHIISIITPENSLISKHSANYQKDPLYLIESLSDTVPVVAVINTIKNKDLYFLFLKENINKKDFDLNKIYFKNDSIRESIAKRIKIVTPDPYINVIGSALSIAADAIWEDPCYLHGAVAWRMPLPGWRGAYAADFLGWHDRARKHFYSYSLSQYTEPDSGPSVPDSAVNFARQTEKIGVSLYTSGYISRYPGKISKPHHYDMNLIYIDQLLYHFMWTGDTSFIKDLWPIIKRHLRWEKRCFDGNDDGLYDAYACIWASDALQYSGGGVTHSSAYNYRANNIASILASIIGDNPKPFQLEAEKIFMNTNKILWLNDEGHYAEFIDLLGEQQVHKSAALWTIYHSNESGLADDFKKYLNTQYVDNNIPNIPFKVNAIENDNYYLLSTTNWMPYTWSINNVAMAENVHTALAYWQAGRNNEAFKLFKSAILESMFLGSSPGNFQQLSSFDAFRGELYRDFADAIGITARTIIEGLFGIKPNALNDTLYIKPGLPDKWDSASVSTPDIYFKYKKKSDEIIDILINQYFKKTLNLNFSLPFFNLHIESVEVNGQLASFKIIDGIEKPILQINFECKPTYHIIIRIRKQKFSIMPDFISLSYVDTLSIKNIDVNILKVYDPQNILSSYFIFNNQLIAKFEKKSINATIFLLLEKNSIKWWHPLKLYIKKPIEIIKFDKIKKYYQINIKNNSQQALFTNIKVYNYSSKIFINKESTVTIKIPDHYIFPGRNLLKIESLTNVQEEYIIDWSKSLPKGYKSKTISLDEFYNDFVTNIFKNKYLSPRSPYPTLQLPIHGFGDWCSYNIVPEIDDLGLRNLAAKNKNNCVKLISNLLFQIQSNKNNKNVVFTSKWNNYPDSISLPLNGKAYQVYLLMTGTTHHMQSRFLNGMITVNYNDGSKENLYLVNPDTWWPIEQDYYVDNYAFKIDSPRPIRVYLKSGISTLQPYEIKQKNKTKFIDGGAATVWNIPLDCTKELKSITIKATANDVIIGLMGITIVKQK